MSEEVEVTKRKTYSRSHSSDELDSWVSQWTNDQVKKHLNIHYNANYLRSPLLVLQKLIGLDIAKLEIDEDLHEEQKKYIEKMEHYLKFSTVIDELFEGYNLESLRNTASEILQKAMKEPEIFVRSKLKSFIRSFERLLKDSEESGEKRKLYEGSFTQFVGDFAEFCCLKPVFSKGNCKNDQVVWKGFRGMPKVIATPDIRFFTEGTPDQCPSDMMVSVVEVKTDSELQFIRWKRRECASKYCPFKSSGSYSETKLIRNRKNCPSKHCPYTTSSSEAELSDRMELLRISRHISSSTSSVSSETPIARSDKPEEVEPEIAIRFGKKVLGQHAGELLFDVHKYCRNVEGCIHRVPGLIVDGTKVFFTMLEISNTHYKKIEENQTLDQDDRATIYYSGSFDILNENKRNILIKNFMRLNNLKKCSCHIQSEEATVEDDASSTCSTKI